MKKKIILLIIILIPSLIYFFFELSEVNFKKMAYYGPKSLNQKGDTLYYSIPENIFLFGTSELNSTNDNKEEHIKFIADSARSRGAKIVLFIEKNQENKLSGLLEFEKYNKEKLTTLEFIIVHLPAKYPTSTTPYYTTYLQDSLGINSFNFFLRTVQGEKAGFENTRSFFFKNKPVHVFNYFAVLLDKNRHIRGYYDPSYISEIKRMTEEYKHLILKDEHANMQTTNKIEQK